MACDQKLARGVGTRRESDLSPSKTSVGTDEINPLPKRKKARTTHEQAASEASRQRRLARYEEVLECYQRGLPIAQIAKQFHLARGTIYKYLAVDSFPERSVRSPSSGTGKLIAPYTTYLRKRCKEGCQSAQQLYREIQL